MFCLAFASNKQKLHGTCFDLLFVLLHSLPLPFILITQCCWLCRTIDKFILKCASIIFVLGCELCYGNWKTLSGQQSNRYIQSGFPTQDVLYMLWNIGTVHSTMPNRCFVLPLAVSVSRLMY